MPRSCATSSSYLKAMQLSVERQVMLEAKIIEVELNDSSPDRHQLGRVPQRRTRAARPAPHRARHRPAGRPPLGAGAAASNAADGLPPPPRVSPPRRQPISGAANVGACSGWRSRPAISPRCSLPRNAGHGAGAVQPAHRHAEQPEGGAQGRHRRVLRHQRHAPTTDHHAATGNAARRRPSTVQPVLLRRGARRHAADRRQRATSSCTSIRRSAT